MRAFLEAGVAGVALLSLIAALPVSAHAWELTIEAPPSLAGAAAQLERADPGRLEQALQRAGLAVPAAVRVALITEDDERARATPAWIVGQAFGSGDVAIFPARVTSYPYSSLESVLWHEVAHVALVARADGRSLPRWFHEGVAVSVATGWRVVDDLQLLLAAGRGPAIADLTRLFESAARPDTAEAYRLATVLVDDLRRRHGAAVPGAIAGRVAQGVAFARAFEMETGETPDQAAAQAWATYRTLAVWVPFLTSRAAVWPLIACLAVVAFFVRLRRRARRRRQWDEDDDA